MKAKKGRKIKPVKRYDQGGVQSDPTGRETSQASRADTIRLVNANQAQMEELLAQGYIPFGEEAIKDSDTATDFVRADRGFFADDSIKLSEIEDAMLKKPWLAYNMFPPGHALGLNKLDWNKGFFADYAKKVEKFLEDNRLPYAVEFPFRQLREALEEFKQNKDTGSFRRLTQDLNHFVNQTKKFPGRNDSELHTESMKSAVNDLRSYDQTLQRLEAHKNFGERPYVRGRKRTLEERYGRRIDSSPASFGGTRTKDDAQFFRDVTRPLNPNPFYASISTADSDLIDIDEVDDLLSQGYGLTNSIGPGDAFFGSGFGSLERTGAAMVNMGKEAYNMIFGDPGKFIVTNHGDLGETRTYVPGTQVNYVDVPDGGLLSKFSNIYPTSAMDTRIQKIVFNPRTDQFEPLEGRFYLDRESEGTGAVRRDDLVKTLFNYDVNPARKLKFYNEELGDVVSIYAYDSPEMLKAAGLERSAYDTAKYGDDPIPEKTQQGSSDLVPYREPMGLPENLYIDPKPPRPMKVVKNRDLMPTSPIQTPRGRFPIQIGALAQSQRGARQGGQKLQREYYYDPVKKQYREREVDSERLGGPVYGGKYSFATGGRVPIKK